MKRTKDYEHNFRRTCAEIRYDFKQWQDIQGKRNDLKEKGRKLKWQESRMKGTWKEDEKENEANGKGNQRNTRRTWKNKRKGGKLNKMNAKQRYDWRKWKEHGRKWKETDRRISTHERNVTRNEREMAGTQKEMFLYVCAFDFSIFTHINCDHHGDHGRAFRIFYLWNFGHGMEGQWKDMNRSLKDMKITRMKGKWKKMKCIKIKWNKVKGR